MLSGVLAANRTGLVAFHCICVLLTITFRQKRRDEIPAAELRLPGVNRVLRDAHLPTHVLGRPPRFQLLQRPDDLRFAVLSLRHNAPPRPEESYTLSCG